MSLIKSISGIRGTIGGKAGDGLNPLDIVKFTAAYATFIRKNTPVKTNKIVVGRDARISGEMVKHTVIGTLMGMGFDVVNIGLATTPTTEIAVTMEKACGGIILTASHNPKQWNALKLLNEKGEFLNAAEGQEVLNIAAAEAFDFADVDQAVQHDLVPVIDILLLLFLHLQALSRVIDKGCKRTFFRNTERVAEDIVNLLSHGTGTVAEYMRKGDRKSVV